MLNIKTIHLLQPFYPSLYLTSYNRAVFESRQTLAIAETNSRTIKMKSKSLVGHQCQIVSDSDNPVFKQALSLSPILGLAAAAAAASTPTPRGFAVIYTLPNCVQVDSKGRVANSRHIDLPYDDCVAVDPLFLSFQGGIAIKCPTKKKAIVLAFPESQCGGTPVSADRLPADESPGPCLEVLLGDSLDDPEAGGRSLFYTCVDQIPI